MGKKVKLLPPVQMVGDSRVDRTRHVWKRRNGDWKCILCGGVSTTPTDDDLVDGVEGLTNEERDLCPPEAHVPR